MGETKRSMGSCTWHKEVNKSVEAFWPFELDGTGVEARSWGCMLSESDGFDICRRRCLATRWSLIRWGDPTSKACVGPERSWSSWCSICCSIEGDELGECLILSGNGCGCVGGRFCSCLWFCLWWKSTVVELVNCNVIEGFVEWGDRGNLHPLLLRWVWEALRPDPIFGVGPRLG